MSEVGELCIVTIGKVEGIIEFKHLTDEEKVKKIKILIEKLNLDIEHIIKKYP